MGLSLKLSLLWHAIVPTLLSWWHAIGVCLVPWGGMPYYHTPVRTSLCLVPLAAAYQQPPKGGLWYATYGIRQSCAGQDCRGESGYDRLCGMAGYSKARPHYPPNGVPLSEEAQQAIASINPDDFRAPGAKENPSASGSRINRTESAMIDARFLELRLLGLTYEQIGTAVGVSWHTVYKRVQRALEKTLREPADAVRQMELDRLDLLWRSVIDRVTAGELDAVRTALSIMDRRAKYLGLDAPVRHEHIIEEARKLADAYGLDEKEMVTLAEDYLRGGVRKGTGT